jgi:hypothetical protein
LAHIKISFCPHCFKLVEFDGYASGWLTHKVGKPEVTPCPKCRKGIHNGLVEWENASFLVKTGYVVFHIFMVFVFGIGGLAAGALLGDYFGETVVFSVLLSLVGMSLVIWVGFNEIKESKHRSRRE